MISVLVFFATQTELITSKGYPCENHEVETDDGFILGLQRIPHGRHYPVAGALLVILLFEINRSLVAKRIRHFNVPGSNPTGNNSCLWRVQPLLV